MANVSKTEFERRWWWLSEQIQKWGLTPRVQATAQRCLQTRAVDIGVGELVKNALTGICLRRSWRIESFSSPETLMAYIRKSIINMSITLANKDRAYLKLLQEYQEQVKTMPHTQEERETEREDRRMKWKLIMEWTEDPIDRLIIAWHFKDGLSHDEIGRRLGMTSQAVRKRWSRREKNLKERWEAERPNWRDE